VLFQNVVTQAKYCPQKSPGGSVILFPGIKSYPHGFPFTPVCAGGEVGAGAGGCVGTAVGGTGVAVGGTDVGATFFVRTAVGFVKDSTGVFAGVVTVTWEICAGLFDGAEIALIQMHSDNGRTIHAAIMPTFPALLWRFQKFCFGCGAG